MNICIVRDFLFAYQCFNLFGYVVLLASPLRPVRGSRPSDGGETPKVADILFGLVQCDVGDSCSIIVGLAPKDLDNCASFIRVQSSLNLLS